LGLSAQDISSRLLTCDYFKRSKLRLLSASNSERRIALDRTMCSICEVEQLPVCSRTTFGGEPKVRLRLTKSLSLVRKMNPFAAANSQIAASDVLPSPTAVT